MGKILYWFFLTFLILTAGIVAVSSFKIPGNIKLLIVESGSMEPIIKTGSIVLVKPQLTYKVGDIITVYDSANHKVSVTHRILETKGETFVTKGDANKSADTEIRLKEDIAGKAVFSVPIIGYLISFAKTEAGLVLLIIVPAAIIIYNEILNIKNTLIKSISIRKNKFSNKTKHKNALITLLVLTACLFFIDRSHANYSSVISTDASMTAATWETPINLSFYREDSNHVGFKISGTQLKSYDLLEYLVTYDTDQTPQGISGTKPINNITEITENGLLLGFCTSGGTCVNFTGVKNIKIEILLKNSSETKIMSGVI